jgi:pimeloyl-ACP methyl ester carboxylesterase
MPSKPSRAADLLGASRLALDAVAGVTALVEAVHMNLLDKAGGAPGVRPVAGVTRLVYRAIKAVGQVAGGGIDAALGRLAPALGEQGGWPARDALVAVLNGVLGDRLEETHNPLAISMALRRAGVPLAMPPAQPSGRIVVLAHGLCMNDLQWERNGVDHGATLERERGYTALYLHYNSGLHVSLNGRAFAQQLEALVRDWPVPVEQLAIVGHSMGGLVARSACHYGAQEGHCWPALLQKMVFLGTPHHGAPLERGGHWLHVVTDLNTYSAPFARLARIRSAGITDLRHGSLLDDDWRDKDRFAHEAALPLPVPLPASVECFAVAGSIFKRSGDMADRLAGDGLVPVASALGHHPDPARQLWFAPANQAVVRHTSHLGLLSSPEVQAHLLAWL